MLKYKIINIDMDYLNQLFFNPKYSEIQQQYFDRLATHVQIALKTKSFKDQELLLLTLLLIIKINFLSILIIIIKHFY